MNEILFGEERGRQFAKLAWYVLEIFLPVWKDGDDSSFHANRLIGQEES